MKKTLTFTLLALAGLVVLVSSGAVNSLILFILVGAVPGTNYTVPSGIMLLVMITIIWMVIFRLAVVEALYSITTTRLKKRHIERKKRLPSRRYDQI